MRKRTESRRDKAMHLITDGIADATLGIREHHPYIEGAGYGKMFAAYWGVLSAAERTTVIGGPVEWIWWLREGLKEAENYAARIKRDAASVA